VKSLNWLETGLALGLLGLVLFELRDPEFRRSWYRDARRLRRNAGFGAASVVTMILLKRLHAVVEDSSLLTIMDWRGHGMLALGACFLVGELAGWGLHYVKHRNPFLWKFHFQHHRENQYNIWLTAHTHGLEVIVSGLLLALLLTFCGFSVLTIEIYLVYYGFMKTFQHSARPYTLGVLDRIFVTPAYHRLHHEVNSGCNYAITITLFDVLFGTARWPSRHAVGSVSYGVSADELLPFGFWKEMIYFIQVRGRGEQIRGPRSEVREKG
jgi:sterol desaturase/sphingolipid hydroxylase (fatty acid hydroxylase superfamily)